MVKKTIFIVHGIGSHPKDEWVNPVTAVLEAAYAKYPSLVSKGAFKDAIDVVPINYDDIFDGIVESWEKSTKGIRDQVSPGQVDVVDKLLDFVESISDNDKVRNYLLDLVFYTLVPTVRAWVLNRVGGAILDHLKTNPERRGGHWNIIGHSMGTSVVHDALQQFVYDKKFDTHDVWAGTVMMVSNCSNLLHDRNRKGYGVYESSVRPQVSAGSTLCMNYLNINHDLDLVAIPDRFKPLDNWATTEIIARKRYFSPPINDARVRNIHALENYLENPIAHSELFKRMFVTTKKFDEEVALAAADYDKGSDKAKFEQLRVRLTNLLVKESLSFSGLAEIRTVLQAFKEYFSTLIKL